MNPLDEQVGGSHYKNYRIQPMVFFHANKIPFPEASVCKYVLRHRDKHGAEDIRKAIHVLEMILEMEYTIKPVACPPPKVEGTNVCLACGDDFGYNNVAVGVSGRCLKCVRDGIQVTCQTCGSVKDHKRGQIYVCRHCEE